MKKLTKRILLVLVFALLLPILSRFGIGTEAGGNGTVYASGTAAKIEVGEAAKKGKNNKTEEQVTVEEDGTYDSKEEVALYLYLYGELPSNYMTKKEAKKLGWEGGSLEQYAKGKCIGGSYFGNSEGILPEEDEYHECDIDTLGQKKRGAKRIVYSDDGDIYYTEDHYETFTLLYTADGPVEEEIIYKAD